MTSAETTKQLTAQRERFDSFVYTPLEQALRELDKRRENKALKAYVDKSLPKGLPSVMRPHRSIILFRNVATPNFETRRFIELANHLSGFHAHILEYTEDQFNNRNEGKYFLGKLHLQKGVSKSGQPIYENVNIIDFNKSNKKSISAIPTKWGQLLVDFHHEMFNLQFKDSSKIAFDLSRWLHSYGMTAKEYYKAVLTLFLRDAILFENFLTIKKELDFTESVILPASCAIEKDSGFKPLIVTLAPTEIEEDEFWYAYPHTTKAFLDRKIGKK